MSGYRIVGLRDFSEASLEDVLASGDIIFFGEVHKVDWIIELESDLARRLYDMDRLGFVGLEWFNYRMDGLVKRWINDEIEWDEFKEEYEKGPEGFPLDSYRPVLETIKMLGVEVVGLMPPRDEVKHISRNGLDGIDLISDSPVSKEEVRLDYEGYKEILYSMFPKEGPMARLDPEKIFMAQAYKDEVIAYRVYNAYRRCGNGLVITGFAHSELYGSASTRLYTRGVDRYVVFSSRNSKLEDVADWFIKNRGYLESKYLAVKI